MKKNKILTYGSITVLLILFCTAGIMTSVKKSEAAASTAWDTQADNAVSVGLATAMQYDQYEYATGSQHGNEIVCFCLGAETAGYSSDNDEINLDITKKACAYAYGQYLQTLNENLPDNFTEEAISFKMTNVYEDTAYVYDIITNSMEIVPSVGLVSSIEIDTNIISEDSLRRSSVNQRWTMKTKD